MKKNFPLSRVYQLIEPGPVIMVTTSYKGKPNIMTMAWHMMVDFVPPLIACVMGEENYSFAILKKTKECVINIPTVELASRVVGVGSASGATIDKFQQFHFTALPALKVNVPMIKECYANLECRVIDMKMVPRYNIFILKVIKAWITPLKKRPRTMHHCGKGVFIVDGKIIKLPFKKK